MAGMRMISVREAKESFSQLVDSIDSTHAAVTITRHGRPAVVMINAQDLDALRETLRLLHDPDHVTEVDQADRDIAEGRALNLSQVRALLGR